MTKQELKTENENILKANAYVAKANQDLQVELKKFQSQNHNLSTELEIQQAHVIDLLYTVETLTSVLKRELE